MKLAVVNQAYLEQADEDDFSVAGISYHNVDVRATYNDLVRALGQPTFDGDSEKSHVEWWGYVEDNQGVKVPNSEWTLYDWKESENPKDNPTEIYEWHIGAKGSISADNVQDLIMRELQRIGASRRRYNGKRVSANNETAWEWNPRRNIIVAERARFWNDILNGEKKMTFFFVPDVQFPCIVYMNDYNTNKLIGKAICDGVTERMYEDGVTRVKLYDWSFSNPYDYGDRAYTIDNPPEKWRYMTQEEKDRIW